ncbi:MAG: hypothetical protein JXK05_08520 [Campylobacterales bacterium]|nr:hypothetical protein [Campylobacterales bacterium]
MKQFLILLLPLWLFAQSHLISPVALPKTYILNLDAESCNNACLQEHLQYGQIFSFLAHSDRKLQDPLMDQIRMVHVNLFNLTAPAVAEGELRIALLLPHRQIGRYAQSTAQSIFAYLLSQNSQYELKSFRIEEESPEQIAKALSMIKAEGFAYLIAPLTAQGARHLSTLDPLLWVYIPTVHQSEISTPHPNLLFGGIDYEAQLEALLARSSDALVIFYDESALGRKLKSQTEQHYLEAREPMHGIGSVYSYGLDQKSSNLKHPLQNNPAFEEATFVLNTPVVKSAMVMSQITLYEVNASTILSTQINYDPLLLTMTQYQDRRKMLIASGITVYNPIISETNALLGNDINYDWINYATTIGIDYIRHLSIGSEREYPASIIDAQVRYPVKLYAPGYATFEPVNP